MTVNASNRVNERLALNQSPLYRIRGLGQLERVLGFPLKDCRRAAKSKKYHTFLNEKGRLIQYPLFELQILHARIAKLLKRIALPTYVHSQKGKSYVGNALEHIGKTPLIKTDVNKFYPSTTHGMVFRMFAYRFECASDIALLLADICCFDHAHLPTGSVVSGYISFFAAQSMFDEISECSTAHKLKMTLFVDDISISGDAATKTHLAEVRRVIASHGYKTKHQKSKSFAKDSVKTVTGVVVTGDGVRLPNCRHKAIHDAKRLIPTLGVDDAKLATRSLLGKQIEANQIIRRKLFLPATS